MQEYKTVDITSNLFFLDDWKRVLISFYGNRLHVGEY